MTKIKVQLNPDIQPSGSDLAIVNAARRSFNTRSTWENEEELWRVNPSITPKLKPKDVRLLEFLARGMTADDFDGFLESIDKTILIDDCGSTGHSEVLVEKLWEWRNTPTHDTPFDHCHVSFEVKAPIFVVRQLVKHEYLVMSEFSRRYITDDIEFYTPDVWRKAAENKKQGSSDEQVYMLGVGSHGEQIRPLPYKMSGGGEVKTHTKDLNRIALELYKEMIKSGVAPEQARMVLPQSTMTEWTWSGSLGAFCKMCRLRLHPEAQYEARLVAKEIYKYLLEYYPVGAKVLVEGVK